MLVIALSTALGVASAGVGRRTSEATMRPVASRTDPLIWVPPISMARVSGFGAAAICVRRCAGSLRAPQDGAPAPAVMRHHVVGLGRAFATGGIDREVARGRGAPIVQHRLNDAPRRLDLLGLLEQR